MYLNIWILLLFFLGASYWTNIKGFFESPDHIPQASFWRHCPGNMIRSSMHPSGGSDLLASKNGDEGWWNTVKGIVERLPAWSNHLWQRTDHCLRSSNPHFWECTEAIWVQVWPLDMQYLLWSHRRMSGPLGPLASHKLPNRNDTCWKKTTRQKWGQIGQIGKRKGMQRMYPLVRAYIPIYVYGGKH